VECRHVGKTSSRHTRRYGEKKRNGKVPRTQAFWRKSFCDVCLAPVVMAEELQESGRPCGALLEDKPDERGILARNTDGYIIRDPDRKMAGTRWLWHSCPGRGQ
jgi:hypothetical protein